MPNNSSHTDDASFDRSSNANAQSEVTSNEDGFNPAMNSTTGSPAGHQAGRQQSFTRELSDEETRQVGEQQHSKHNSRDVELIDVDAQDISTPGEHKHKNTSHHTQKKKKKDLNPKKEARKAKIKQQREQLTKYLKNELNPKKHQIVGYCCPQYSVASRVLPSDIREAKGIVIQKKRKNRLKRAVEMYKTKRIRRMERRLLQYRYHVQAKLDHLNNKRATGGFVSEAKIKKQIKKLGFVDSSLQKISNKFQEYAEKGVETGISLRRRIWNFIRGKEEYPPNKVKWKDLAREQRNDVKSFILDVGYCLCLYNVPTYRLEYSLTLLAAYYGTDIELQSTPTQLLISFHDYSIDEEGIMRDPGMGRKMGLTSTFSSDSLAELEDQFDDLDSDISDDSEMMEKADILVEEHIHQSRDGSETAIDIPSPQTDELPVAIPSHHENGEENDTNGKGKTENPNDNGKNSSIENATFDKKNTNTSNDPLTSPSVSEPERLTNQQSFMIENTGNKPKKASLTDIDFLVHNSTHFLRIPGQQVNLNKLVHLEDCIDNIHRGTMTIKEGGERVRQIIEKKENRIFGYLSILATLLSCTAFSVLLNANWKEMVAVVTSAIFIVILEMIQSKITALNSIFVTLTGLIAGLVAAGYKALFLEVLDDGRPLNIFIVALAANVGFFPGLGITVSVNELAERRYLSGIIRFTAAMIQVLKIGFGILLSNSLAVALFPNQLAQPTGYENPFWAYLIAVFFAVMSYIISLRAPWHILSTIFIYVAAYGAFASSIYISRYIGTEFGALIGALWVGFCGELYSKLSDHPSLTITSVSILLLVPGSLGVRSIVSFSQRDTVGAVDFIFQIFIVAISLVVGLATGSALVPKKKTITI